MRGYSCATVYEQKIGGLYSGSVADSRFIKTHEEKFIHRGTPVVTVARDLGECLCSAADYVWEGDLLKTLEQWKYWFGGIVNFFRTLERLDALVIHYDKIEEGIDRILQRFPIEPDIQPLSSTEWNKITDSNKDHFICPMRRQDQANRIIKANQMIRREFPELVAVCRRIGWTRDSG